ncbi:hypothetical protein [Conyzicola sp.]|uniref:hypothetical protein n=1 Tax=Conyzicola sp. TaxID=1969404 RepID=UPI003989D980
MTIGEGEHLSHSDAEEISEDLKPSTGLWPSKVSPLTAHNATTRRWIAMPIFWTLIGLYLVAAVAFSAGFIDVDGLVRLVAAFSGIQTLCAAIVGFYFAKGDS